MASNLLLVLSTAVAVATAGCNSGALSSGPGGNRKSADGESDKQEGSGDSDDENENGSIPEEVSGAFLICAEADDFETESTSSSARGCAFEKNGKKVDVVVKNPVVELVAGGLRFSTEAAVAPASSRWHFHFAVPDTAKNTLSHMAIALTVNGKRLKFDKDTTSGLGDWQIMTFGSGGSNQESVEISSEGTPATFLHVVFTSKESFAVGSNTPSSFDGQMSASARCAEVAATDLATSGQRWVAVMAGPSSLQSVVGSISGDVLNTRGLVVMKQAAAGGPLLRHIGYDQHGSKLPEGAVAWTGSRLDGDVASSCNNWGSTSGMGTVGDPQDLERWISSSEIPCSDASGRATAARLICLSVP